MPFIGIGQGLRTGFYRVFGLNNTVLVCPGWGQNIACVLAE